MDLISIIYFIVIIAGFACLTILPRRKQRKQMKEMMDSMRVGLKIQTIGGILGTILEIKDNLLTIETGAANILIAKTAVAHVIPAEYVMSE